MDLYVDITAGYCLILITRKTKWSKTGNFEPSVSFRNIKGTVFLQTAVDKSIFWLSRG